MSFHTWYVHLPKGQKKMFSGPSQSDIWYLLSTISLFKRLHKNFRALLALYSISFKGFGCFSHQKWHNNSSQDTQNSMCFLVAGLVPFQGVTLCSTSGGCFNPLHFPLMISQRSIYYPGSYVRYWITLREYCRSPKLSGCKHLINVMWRFRSWC